MSSDSPESAPASVSPPEQIEPIQAEPGSPVVDLSTPPLLFPVACYRKRIRQQDQEIEELTKQLEAETQRYKKVKSDLDEMKRQKEDETTRGVAIISEMTKSMERHTQRMKEIQARV